ncbi:nuclear pore complex protein NUP98A isoform X2 [Beta vulgaris subsp. vulgaris]|uniref:nuclear pore complex protein NUP98A isoform X2 n=1 Tax=Beta vulgaris subsp. vulgaris TaxID=3555 RepID=UPI00053FC95A|nr:nuclear pore complex protein NUP98A isoform X2 [Beta vulgaris subsp. vulgaris]
MAEVGSFGTSHEFGNGSNSSNLFPSNAMGTTNLPNLPTNGSGFGGSASNIYGASLSSSIVSSPIFSGFGQKFGTTDSSHNSFARNTIGNTSNACHIPFMTNTVGTITSPSYFSQGSTFGGSSSGVFGASSLASSPSFMFGQGSGSSALSSISGSTTNAGCNPFASKTVGSVTVPSSSKESLPFGGTSSSSFLTSSATCRTNEPTSLLGPFSFGSERITFNPKSVTGSDHPLQPDSQPVQMHTIAGTRTNSYKHTIVKQELKSCKLISISAMPSYESKTHEELRWEDYKMKSGGERNLISNQVDTQKLGLCLPSTSSLAPLSPHCISPAFFTNMNTPTFPVPCLSSSNSSPIFSTLNTKTSALGSSYSTSSVPPQGPNVLLTVGSGSLRSCSYSSNHSLHNPQSPSQSSGMWPSHSLGTTPNFLVTEPPYTGSGLDQVTAGNPAYQPTIPCAHNGNLMSHMNPTPSPFTTPPISTGNNVGVPLDVGQPQPSLQEQSFATVKVLESIIAVKDPFGSEHVPNKSARTRVSSFLTLRHRSVKPLTINVRKYHPRSYGPKVPFFNLAEEIKDTSKAYIVPRENPRSVFTVSAEMSHVSTSKEEAYSLNHACAVEYEDGRSDDATKDHISNSTPNSFKDHFIEADNNAKYLKKSLMPKLQRSDYYTEPSIEKLASIESSNPGFCCRIKDFMVGREGYGWVKFYGETDVRGLDLDSIIHFNNREVIVYDVAGEKPPIGEGLNKAAEVTLLNIKCIDKTGKQYTSGKIVDKYIEKLKKLAEKQGAETVSYNPIKGEWRFSVQHF